MTEPPSIRVPLAQLRAAMEAATPSLRALAVLDRETINGSDRSANFDRTLTRSSDFTREGLAVSATRIDLPDEILSRRIVTDQGCWEWTGRRSDGGYGRVGYKRRTFAVHRLIASVVLGFDYDDRSIYACHKCDNPPCFNPDHLFAGTPSDNIQDCIAKGRANRAQPRPGARKHPATRQCDVCGTSYEPPPDHRGTSQTCSKACLSVRLRGKPHLTADQLRAVKRDLAAGIRVVEVAAKHGISPSYAYHIRNGKIPRHAPSTTDAAS